MADQRRRTDPVRLYWWRWKYPDRLNFGDEISAPIIEALTGRRVEWTDAETCDLVAAGSVIQQITRTKRQQMPMFWGTGLINPPKENAKPVELPALALRGELTRTRVRTPNGSPVLGDPGIFADLLLRRPVKKRWAVGVLPHYHDASDPFVDQLLDLGSRVRRLNVAWTPEEMVHEIAACDVLLSSSLHGLIVADSLGVPNIHLKFGNRLMGGEYKFRDYNSIFSPGRHRAYRPKDLPMRKAGRLRSFVEEAFIPPENIQRIQRDLAKALI